MSNQEHTVACQCGEHFLSRAYLARHYKTSCNLNPNVLVLTCDACNRRFSRIDSLKRHKEKFHPEITIPSSQIGETNVSRETNERVNIDIKGDQNTSITTVNSNNNTIVNNYNIHYTADLTSDNIMEKLLSFYKEDYIKKGEDGFYDFLLEKVFTDPKDVNRLAIACTNYNQKKFVYSMKDDDNETPLICEDYKLNHLEQNHLSNYNTWIKEIIVEHSDKLINCKGKTTQETKENVQKLMDSILARKKLSDLMAGKIRSKRTKLDDKTLRQEMLQEKWNEMKKDFIAIGKYNVSSSPKENIDNTLSRLSFMSASSKQEVAQYENEIKEEEDSLLLYDQCLQESIREQEEYEIKAREKARLRKEEEAERERKHIEALERKEMLRRAKEVEKQQALKEKIDKKKKKLDNKVIIQSGSTPVKKLDTIEE